MIKPMTISSARSIGLFGVEIVCQSCWRSAIKAFDDLCLPEEMPIPSISHLRRFVCTGCGGRKVVSLPDWQNYVAPGMGGMGG